MIGAGVLAWSRALGEFSATLMLVGATRMKTETLPTSIYLNMATGDTGPAIACAMILFLAGFYEPSSGSVSYDGTNVCDIPIEDRNIGFVYQDNGLFPQIHSIFNCTLCFYTSLYSSGSS